MYWLFEAKKRYGLSIQNFMVTSNHVHLLVGIKKFVERLKEGLGYRSRGRRINKSESGSELREHVYDYTADFDVENGVLSQNNSYVWNHSHEFPEG